MKKNIVQITCCALMACAILPLQAITKSKDQTMLTTGQEFDLKKFKSTPTGILFEITKHGTGTPIKNGQTATVHYIGHLLADKNKVGAFFDSSRKRGTPFKFKVGAGQVIKGWDLSLQDMKVGETRIVILPPAMAYGAQAVGNIIPANATLIFEIEALGAQ